MTDYAAEIDRLMQYADVHALPLALGEPLGSAELRTHPEDFFVSEYTGLQPAGKGEHWLVRIRKTGQNTGWVAKRLAELLAVPQKAISYAGMKDRHAVTEQWFSVHLPGQPDPELVIDAGQGFEIIATARHDRKLRPGQLSYNRFKLRLRACKVVDRAAVDTRLRSMSERGVPNYFGPQRFGHHGANLRILSPQTDVRRLNRDKRAFALSALRSALFNGYLAMRVSDASWDSALPDDVLISDRQRGVAADDESIFLSARQPAGLLWGQNSAPAGTELAAAEQQFFAAFPLVTQVLERAGSKASRRVLGAPLGELSWQWQEDELLLEFALGPGSYATTALREVLTVTDVTGP